MAFGKWSRAGGAWSDDIPKPRGIAALSHKESVPHIDNGHEIDDSAINITLDRLQHSLRSSTYRVQRGLASSPARSTPPHEQQLLLDFAAQHLSHTQSSLCGWKCVPGDLRPFGSRSLTPSIAISPANFWTGDPLLLFASTTTDP